jgi:phenylacetate-CoA ligase
VPLNFYTRLVSSFLFPLQEKLKHHDTVKIRKDMERTQWLSPEHLEEFRVKRLRTFLADVDKHVPYFRNFFRDMAFDPSSIQSTSDITSLPFLTKDLIRANTDRLKSDVAHSLVRFNTGGSSGEPLIFYLGNERVSHDVAAKWRATRWWNVDIGDPEIVVWGSPIELGSQDKVRMIRDHVMRTKLIPAFEMSEEKLDIFLRAIRTMRPKMLFGYPSALSHIARHADAKGICMDDLGIRVAFTTSERLYDEQRQQIASTFACRVANGYGGRDSGFIAHECPSGGMHITAEDLIVEIIDSEGKVLPPSQSGEIVITHLATKDFPFIRYRTGDIGILDENACPCGRGLPLLKEIQGRTTDFVVARDGTVMHGLALIYILRDLPGIKAFKIIQESLDRTRVLLATDCQFDEQNCAEIITGFKQRLGQSVKIEIERVAAIPKESSGKFRYIVSKVTGTTAETET